MCDFIHLVSVWYKTPWTHQTKTLEALPVSTAFSFSCLNSVHLLQAGHCLLLFLYSFLWLFLVLRKVTEAKWLPEYWFWIYPNQSQDVCWDFSMKDKLSNRKNSLEGQERDFCVSLAHKVIFQQALTWSSLTSYCQRMLHFILWPLKESVTPYNWNYILGP